MTGSGSTASVIYPTAKFRLFPANLISLPLQSLSFSPDCFFPFLLQHHRLCYCPYHRHPSIALVPLSGLFQVFPLPPLVASGAVPRGSAAKSHPFRRFNRFPVFTRLSRYRVRQQNISGRSPCSHRAAFARHTALRGATSAETLIYLYLPTSPLPNLPSLSLPSRRSDRTEDGFVILIVVILL